ncbi:MAG: hypothetical protein WBF17_28010 [Phycisphaerae bacterium]
MKDYLSCLLVTAAVAAAVGSAAEPSPEARASRGPTRPAFRDVPRKVLAFYYPWYGIPSGPGGAGRTVHWGRIDEEKKEIQASTHYPALGAYDSHDPKLIDQHCRWAVRGGLDGWIVSWWGHGSYSGRVMGPILDACKRHKLAACIYYETVPMPQTPQTAADDIVKVLRRHGDHPAHLRAGGKPVVFVYGRALGEIGVAGWLKAAAAVNERYEGGAALIGDRFDYGSARVFDGLHTYNTAGMLRGKEPAAARAWASATYGGWVRLADEAGRISTLTVIPGYDDTKVRKPGLAVKRYDGALYRGQWAEAIRADPHWVLITSFNEWHEGSEIEPSAEDGEKYLSMTAEYARRFKSKPRAARAAPKPQVPAAETARLREKLASLPLAVLPKAESSAFWWLAADLGAKVEEIAWKDLAADRLSPKTHPVLLYAGGEHCPRTVTRDGDVDAAIARYLKAGGCLVAMPSLPWPFYYDEQDRPQPRRSAALGLTLRMGWEQPPESEKLRFVQPGKTRLLPHLPKELPFPASGDLRWRPFVAGGRGGHVPLLTLVGAKGKSLGEAIAYVEPPTGGRVVYVWFALLHGPNAPGILHDVFDFVASRLGRSG